MFSHEELQEIELFIRLLFPWDEDGAKLFKTVSWTFTDADGNQAFANYATQSYDDLIKLITSRARRRGADIYVALGTQRLASMEKFSTDGFPKAIRQHKNIVNYQSIYLDIDVGKDNGYATTEDAFQALDGFIHAIGLPQPTMEIFSGSGGLHVYWCTLEPMPLANWKPLAHALHDAGLRHGLKFDPQVTVNPAGILRVPNTLNHKRQPAKQVRLYRTASSAFPRYEYQQLVGALSGYMDGAGLKRGPGTRSSSAHKYMANVDESSPPVSIDDIAVNCGVFDDILERGGKGDQEPLWNLALYAAAFTTDAYAAAHRLSQNDPRYTKDATEKKLEEKIAARQQNPEAGWPKCESFAAQHIACATCPLYAQRKTPFHFAFRAHEPPPQAASIDDEPPPKGADELMPPGFWRNKKNHVMTTLYDGKNQPYLAEVINYPILDGGLDEDGNLLYEVVISAEPRWREISVSSSAQPLTVASALMRNGLFINPKSYTAARDFLVAWVAHLQTIKRKAEQGGYGWVKDGKEFGFAFDDKIYRANRVDTVSRGKTHDPSFTVKGELAPWQDAMQLIYGNHPLETVVAAAFAAPLISLIGSASVVTSIYSAASGVGKSTAMMLGQAVWGNPRTGMSTLNDTTNSMMKKIGDLRMLPVYWDELRTKDQLERIVDIVFSVTQGKGKARLNKDITQADAPAFTTLFCVASNYGLGDSIYNQTEATQAGGLRLFEIEALPLRPTMSDHKARQLLISLQDNYGVAGAQYAKWLAINRKNAHHGLNVISDDLQERFKLEPKERFWAMTVTALLCGAAFANNAGLTQFDLLALRDYLEAVLLQQRGEMKTQEFATMQATADVTGLLDEMIAAIRHKNLIITDTVPFGERGKPVTNTLIDTDLSRLGEVWMQLGNKDGHVRARVRQFNQWLRERRLNPRQIITGLRAHYEVTQSKQTIGAGVPGLDAATKFGRSECYDFSPREKSSGSS